MIDLSGKTVLITGASSGLGRQCAITLSRLGAILGITGRDSTRLSETLGSLSGYGHFAIAFDLGGQGNPAELISNFVHKIGPLTGFIHAAGIQLTRPLSMMNAERFGSVMQVNVTSAFELSRIITKKGYISEGGASFVFIASIMGIVSRPGLIAYSASKGALIAGACAMAVELVRKKITVNCISPGMIRTPLIEEHLSELDEKQIQERIKLYPLGLGTPKDIATMCAYLISQRARWITGTNIVIDGGYSAL